MTSMIIMDRMGRMNIELVSKDNTDPQLSVFGQALEDARRQEATFASVPKAPGQTEARDNPYLSAAKDLEAAGYLE